MTSFQIINTPQNKLFKLRNTSSHAKMLFSLLNWNHESMGVRSYWKILNCRFWKIHIRLDWVPWHGFKSLLIIDTDEDDVKSKTTVNIHRKRKATVTFEEESHKSHINQEMVGQTVNSSVDSSLTKGNNTRNLQCPKMSRLENEWQQWSWTAQDQWIINAHFSKLVTQAIFLNYHSRTGLS